MTKKIILTVLAMAVIAFIDFNSDEVQAPAFLIILFSFIAGYLDSKNAWAYALSIGGTIFLGNLSFKATGMIPRDPNIKLYTALIALVPAFIGAYLGYLSRYIFGTLKTSLKVN